MCGREAVPPARTYINKPPNNGHEVVEVVVPAFLYAACGERQGSGCQDDEQEPQKTGDAGGAGRIHGHLTQSSFFVGLRSLSGEGWGTTDAEFYLHEARMSFAAAHASKLAQQADVREHMQTCVGLRAS